jgi:hypothetical protein
MAPVKLAAAPPLLFLLLIMILVASSPAPAHRKESPIFSPKAPNDASLKSAHVLAGFN